MGSTLEHGIYLPSEGEKNCYQGLAGNWNKVDGALGDIAELKQSIESKFTKEIVTELPTEDINPFCIYMILKTDPETDNVYDEWVYINNSWEYLGNTKVDMTQYYTKQEVNQLPAVASGVTATKVGNYDAHIANGDIHVTTSDKTKWTNSANTHVLRLAKSALTPSSSTNAFSNLDDSTALKVGDKVMDTAGVIFEVTAIDTQNSTFTIGTALIDLAQDSGVVHVTGNETVGGVKSFSDDTYIKSLNFTNEVASASSSSSSIMPIITTITYGDGSPSVSARLNLRVTADGVKSFYPHENNQYSLGLASRRLKEIHAYSIKVSTDINGLNPSSLSLPDLANGVDISSYVDVTQTTQYTAPANGYISIASHANGTHVVCVKDTSYDYGTVTRAYQPSSVFELYAVIPVVKNHTYDITFSAQGVITLDYARFFPCLGNV